MRIVGKKWLKCGDWGLYMVVAPWHEMVQCSLLPQMSINLETSVVTKDGYQFPFKFGLGGGGCKEVGLVAIKCGILHYTL